MENSPNLENITKFLLAMNKLKKRQEDPLSAIHDTIRQLSGFLPDNRGSLITQALQKSSDYSRAYREIKRHVRYEGNSKADFIKVTKAVKAVAPVLEKSQRVWIDKLIRIADVLNS